MVYVIDYRTVNGYLCRVPRPVGEWLVARLRFHDVTEHPWGEDDPQEFTTEQLAAAATWNGWRALCRALRDMLRG